MKNTYRIIPTYTGDVSGVCSALYELGGMVVMHDPSGCNSTYNTHDETRWYDRESLIYISGLSELDAILGNDKKLIEDIVRAAEEMKPKFIALASSPIPFLNGTDFNGIAHLVEKKTGIMTFFVPSNGIHDYSFGVADAWLELAKRIQPKQALSSREREEKTYVLKSGDKINLLGLTPLDFDGPNLVEDLCMQLTDYEIISKWAMGDSLDALRKSFEADCNLVVSVTGLKLARWMEENYNIPYIVKLPVTDSAFAAKAMEKGGSAFFVGEPVLMRALADLYFDMEGKKAYVVNPLETEAGVEDFMTVGEEDLEELLSKAKLVLGDPLYQPVVPEGCSFIPYSHEAFSGRCFRGQRRNPFSLKNVPFMEWK